MATYSATELAQAKKLIPYKDMMDRLAQRENLTTRQVPTDGSEQVKFDFSHQFAEGFDDLQDDDVVLGTGMRVGNAEYRLTKGAFVRALQQVGLRPTYGKKTPGHMLAEHVTYHFTHNNTNSSVVTVLARDDTICEMVPDDRQVFSTYQVVDTVASNAAEHFGIAPELMYFDYKYQDDLDRSALRLIVPDTGLTISTNRHGAQVEDIWSTGIAIQNSMTGDVQTKLSVAGYLFAWWCTNGSTTTKAHSEQYSKRAVGGDWEDVRDWLAMSTVNTLELLPDELSKVEALTLLDLSGELGTTAQDVIRTFDLPISAMDRVKDYLVENDDMTGYGLMQAITQAANDSDISDIKRSRILEAGGAVAHSLVDRCATCHRIPA